MNSIVNFSYIIDVFGFHKVEKDFSKFYYHFKNDKFSFYVFVSSLVNSLCGYCDLLGFFKPIDFYNIIAPDSKPIQEHHTKEISSSSLTPIDQKNFLNVVFKLAPLTELDLKDIDISSLSSFISKHCFIRDKNYIGVLTRDCVSNNVNFSFIDYSRDRCSNVIQPVSSTFNFLNFDKDNFVFDIYFSPLSLIQKYSEFSSRDINVLFFSSADIFSFPVFLSKFKYVLDNNSQFSPSFTLNYGYNYCEHLENLKFLSLYINHFTDYSTSFCFNLTQYSFTFHSKMDPKIYAKFNRFYNSFLKSCDNFLYDESLSLDNYINFSSVQTEHTLSFSFNFKSINDLILNFCEFLILNFNIPCKLSNCFDVSTNDDNFNDDDDSDFLNDDLYLDSSDL
jgi:hypothetical protein